jgi:hypothetical protein
MLAAVGGLEAFLAKRGVDLRELGEGPLGFDRWHRACEFARSFDALMEHPDASWTPELGDVVHVARDRALHWLTLVECHGGNAWKSVDGGQLNEHGFQAIYELARSFMSQPTPRGADRFPHVLELTSWKPVAAVIRVGKILDGLGL